MIDVYRKIRWGFNTIRFALGLCTIALLSMYWFFISKTNFEIFSGESGDIVTVFGYLLTGAVAVILFWNRSVTNNLQLHHSRIQAYKEMIRECFLEDVDHGDSIGIVIEKAVMGVLRLILIAVLVFVVIAAVLVEIVMPLFGLIKSLIE